MLEHKIAIVTGAGQGLGRGIVWEMAQAACGRLAGRNIRGLLVFGEG